MKLRFTKMQGAGNDFIMIDATREAFMLDEQTRRRLADRHFGIGADQILVVEPATQEDVDFRYRIFNADGGEVEQCGNGARCFARFVYDQGLTQKRRIRVETLKGIIEPAITDDGRVTVDMGAPVFEPAQVPFDAAGLEGRSSGADTLWLLRLNQSERWVSVLSMGNPHAVQLVDALTDDQVQSEGPLVERHQRFPARVNAGFMQHLGGNAIALRVWERGVGETLACGTGACAAAVAAIRQGLVRSPVTVHTRGGLLTIAWEGAEVLMTGPAQTVFSGEIEL